MSDLEAVWYGYNRGLTVDYVALVMAPAMSLYGYWREVSVDDGHLFVDWHHP